MTRIPTTFLLQTSTRRHSPPTLSYTNQINSNRFQSRKTKQNEIEIAHQRPDAELRTRCNLREVIPIQQNRNCPRNHGRTSKPRDRASKAAMNTTDASLQIRRSQNCAEQERFRGRYYDLTARARATRRRKDDRSGGGDGCHRRWQRTNGKARRGARDVHLRTHSKPLSRCVRDVRRRHLARLCWDRQHSKLFRRRDDLTGLTPSVASCCE